MGQANIPAMATSIKKILDAANTTTSSPDLSSGMSTRVAGVLRLNPALMPVQASLYPLVCVYVDRVNISLEGIVKNQDSAKRKAEINFKVAGVVWEDNTSSYTLDDAEIEAYKLMENIEQVLRTEDTFSNTCTWVMPENIDYFATDLGEDTHLRAGVFSIKAIKYY